MRIDARLAAGLASARADVVPAVPALARRRPRSGALARPAPDRARARQGRFDVILPMISRCSGAATIDVFEAAVLMFLFSLSTCPRSDDAHAARSMRCEV
jgi:hypothetical protein